MLAIFGRETDYGRAKDTRGAIRVLATQAYLGKRKEKFREEFLAALKIVQDGVIKPADMKSSWAGAMGLTQLLASVRLSEIRGRSRRRRPRRHLEFRAGRTGVGGETASRQRLAARLALGL